ncbi:MATE family efflux transporter [Limibaculum sp. M0105]|uniref:MATE family efflux transporter n=1 Tax=Thermohalobaculum xanthum TaxID=2753746 RepID=A0A8J7M5V2_9RHOB|nr:MATE family efflux transporter [Thermohalobaculum xanthum]MBK0399086.1 MATE family efflux transporter [Thermohalobaculum xanthum]
MKDTPAATGPATEPFAARVARHVSDLLRLAWPVMLSRAGILLMAFCDIAMLGRYAPGAVGEANLGLSVFVPVLVIAIGLSSGIAPVVAHAFGRGNWAECGQAWRRGLVWSLVISTLGAWGVWQGEWVLAVLGQSPDFSAKGGAVAQALAPGLIAQTVFAVSAFYLEATRRPMAGLVVMLGANVLNFGLNWLLIFGHAGFPELGAVGAALASTLVRFAAAFAMIAIILLQRDPRHAGVTGPWETFWGPGGWRAGYLMRKLGFSAGLANGFETVGFAAMSLFAASLGPLALDAYSISHNLVATLFMVGLGLAVATGVRVGIETGRDRPDEAAFAGWTGLGVSVVTMSILGAAVFLGRDSIAAVYTDDPAVMARAAALFAFSALVFVPDSAQVVMGQAVRALGDAWIAILAYVLAFTILLIPVGWWMVNRGGWDESGLVVTIIGCCIVAVVLLAWRFRVLTRGASR